MKLNITKIQALMDAKDMSKAALADRMKVSESWVYEILAGRQGKTFATVGKLAEALGVKEKDIVL